MNIYKSILLVGAIFMVMGCTNDFENININPNTPVDVEPEFLLRKVLYEYADQMSYEGFVAGNLLGQYFTAIDFNLFDRHSLTEPQYGGKPWNFLYENLRDNEILLTKSRANPSAAVYEGPAMIYKAYVTMALTDLYGDVPFSEAIKGKEGIVSPAYDTQKDIYMKEGGIIQLLDKAILSIEAYKGVFKLKGDAVYNGDLNQWKKWAYSLKFKALMRISDKENVSVSLQDILVKNTFIKTNADDAIFAFTFSPPNNFKMSTARIGDFNLFVMSATIDSIFRTLNDPRQNVYFRPTAGNANVFLGLNNGPDASKLSITTSQYSLTGRVFREDAGKFKFGFMTAFEMNFLLAEAAEKGYITGNAKTYYETGIAQAFEFWSVTIPSDYLSRNQVSYKKDGANAMQQIITQKWLGNITNGYEGWIEYRRTGYPVLKPVTASLNQGKIPVRMPYPTSEEALNTTNFKTASTNTNNNSVNAPVWWDK